MKGLSGIDDNINMCWPIDCRVTVSVWAANSITCFEVRPNEVIADLEVKSNSDVVTSLSNI